MLACDIVIASDTAKFGTPEVNVGLWPMMIGAVIFRNALRKKAMEMVLLGEKLSAGQAVEMGLITPGSAARNAGRRSGQSTEKPHVKKPHRHADRQAGILRHGGYAL